MERLNGPVATIPALCLVVFLLIADNQVAGQGTLQHTPDTQREPIATMAQAAPASPSDRCYDTAA